MISPSSSAVVEHALEDSHPPRSSRVLVTIVAPDAKGRRRIAGRRVVVGNDAADGAAVAHRRITDLPGKGGKRRVIAAASFATTAWVRGAPDDAHRHRPCRRPAVSGMPVRLTSVRDRASRCFIVGSSVCPPDSACAPSAGSPTASASVVGFTKSKLYIVASSRSGVVHRRPDARRARRACRYG